MYCVMAGWKVQNTSHQALAFVEVTLKMIKSNLFWKAVAEASGIEQSRSRFCSDEKSGASRFDRV